MQWIKDIVEGTIEYYGTRNVKELAEMLDITVIHKEFVKPGMKASLYKNVYNDCFIYLSNTLNEQEEKYILAHELGHILLHDISCEFYSTSMINKSKLEYQANYFASLLLLDKSSIDKYSIENFSIDQLSAYFEIPKELIQYYLDEVV